MKVVINRCYGGFGVSPEALLELIKRKSKVVTKEKVEDYTSDIEFFKRDLVDFKDGFKKYRFYPVLYKSGYVYYIDSLKKEVRTDKDLIDVVESLGNRANTEYSKLKVVEIPDDVEWEIGEYDGVEWVSEKHRIWK